MSHIFFENISKINSLIQVRSERVSVRYTNFMLGFIRFFYLKGIIRGYSVINYYNWEEFYYNHVNHLFIIVFLKYSSGTCPLFNKLKIISKPSRRVYWTFSQMALETFSRAGDGYYIISTNKGLFSSVELILLGTYNIVTSGEVLLRVEF